MNGTATTLPRRSFGQTMRADIWWTQPLLVFLGLGTFVVYSTWAAFQGQHYYFGNYISPFYSPELFGNSPHSWFGTKPLWWPAWLIFSPALLISFPLIMQNVHRYFLYLALIFIFILSYDVWKALWFVDPATGSSSLGLGVGTIVLAINVVLVSGYTFGCHSLRHLVGGFLDQFSKSPTTYRAYACVSCLNRRHMPWAWFSLFWVGFTDLYVRLCSMGIWHDIRLV